MAIEIVNREYIFTDPMKTFRSSEVSNEVYANYLHDLESILWIIIWTLLKYQKNTTDVNSDPIESIKERVKLNQELFSHEHDIQQHRKRCLTNKPFLSSGTVWVPESFQPLRDLAYSFRNLLFCAYYGVEAAFESSKVIKPPSEGSVHLSILNAFKECMIDGFGVTLINYGELADILNDLLLSKEAASAGDTDENVTKKIR